MTVKVALVLSTPRDTAPARRWASAGSPTERPAWELRVWEPALDPSSEISRWRRGIVGHLGDRRLARRILRWGIPAVNVSLRVDRSPFPLVTVDNRAVGAAAARHLLNLKGSRYAVVGGEAAPYARLREEGFLETLRRARADGEALRAEGVGAG
jgi:hypothetical protein